MDESGDSIIELREQVATVDGKEGRKRRCAKEGRKGGRKEERGVKDGWKVGRKEGGKKERKQAEKGRKEGRIKGRNDGRRDGREGRNGTCITSSTNSVFFKSS